MKHILALLLTVSCSAAFAADNGSQYQWQTPADKWEVTPKISLGSQTSTATNNGGDTKTSLFGISVLGEYGISEMFSAGLKLSNVNNKEEMPNNGGSDKTTGLEDLGLFFHGRTAMGPGSFRFGADVGFSLSKKEVKANGDETANSGGLTLAPFVGYEISSDKCTYGARLSYKMLMGDATSTNKGTTPATESKVSAGQSTALALFYEHDMAPVTLGAALEIDSMAKIESKTGTTTTKTAGRTVTGLKLYVPYTVNDMITILPEFRYAQHTAKENRTIDSVSGWDLGVGARFQF